MRTVNETLEDGKDWLSDCFEGTEGFDGWLETESVRTGRRRIEAQY